VLSQTRAGAASPEAHSLNAPSTSKSSSSLLLSSISHLSLLRSPSRRQKFVGHLSGYARVGPQSTFQLLASVVQARLYRSHGAIQDIGDVDQAKPLQVEKDDHHSLRHSQRLDGLIHYLHDFLPLESPFWRTPRDGKKSVEHLFKGDQVQSFLRSPVVATVHDDAVQPRTQRRVPVDAVDIVVRTQEAILEEFLRRATLPGDGQRCSIQLVLVFAVQNLKGTQVPGLNPGHQVPVVKH